MSFEELIKSHDRLHKIGFGNSGSVWAIDKDADLQTSRIALAIKREDASEYRSIKKETRMHRHIISTIESSGRLVSTRHRINIPRHVTFVPLDSEIWPKLLLRFPSGFEACNALVSERIMPLSRPIRAAITTLYCPGAPENFVADKSNEHCLVRPYLGKRRFANRGPRRLKSYSLQNFPLHMDQIEELNLPSAELACAMADALVFLYWVARVDARDVEFVLGRRRGALHGETAGGDEGPSIGGAAADVSSAIFGEHALWLLDFDLCDDLAMTDEGMKKAADAFCDNDSYFPRPGRQEVADQELWKAFTAHFLDKSDSIFDEQSLKDGESVEAFRRLPGLLIDEITAEIARRAHRVNSS
jgi:hypothetical protein